LVLNGGEVIFKGKQQFSLDHLTDGRIERIFRSGKYIVFEISKAKIDSNEFDYMYMLVHLGMTGGFLINEQHNNTRIAFKIGYHTVVYYDIRKFGSIKILNSDELVSYISSRKLGIDAFNSNKYQIEMILMDAFYKKSRKVRSLLLDQTIISGLGNIYVNEVMFRCGIHPEALTNQVIFDDVTCLASQIEEVLKESYAVGGSSIKDYMDVNRKKGHFQDHLLVYGRKNKPCKICESIIEKIEVSGRSSFFCPTCQSE
jgi:formamidopyrimidine-DNA glycosylase